MPMVSMIQTDIRERYPLISDTRFLNASISFLNGDSQRYPMRREATRIWKLQYNGLREAECASYLEFLDQEIRAQASFVYQDPVTGISHSHTLLNDGETSVEQLGVNNARVKLTIRNEGI